MTSQRISRSEALSLAQGKGEGGNLFELGRRAHQLRLERAEAGTVTYLVDRNINYTNACVTDCKFCAFYRPPGDPEAYVLDRETIAGKIRETQEAGGTLAASV